MKHLDYVKIVKLGSVEDPYVDTPTVEEYEQNKVGKTIPTDYTVEGYLAGIPPTLVPTNGFPHPRHSNITVGLPSFILGNTKTSQEFNHWAISGSDLSPPARIT